MGEGKGGGGVWGWGWAGTRVPYWSCTGRGVPVESSGGPSGSMRPDVHHCCLHDGQLKRARAVCRRWAAGVVACCRCACVARDPLHHYLSPQGCPKHSMAVKHNTRRWNLEKYAKRVLSRLFLRDFGPKRVVGATKWVQNLRGSDQRWLFIISLGSNANSPLQRQAGHTNCLKKAIFAYC